MIETEVARKATAFAQAHRLRSLQIVASVLERSTIADAWNAAVFGADEELIFSTASTGTAADTTTLLLEVRRARFAGVVLPMVALAVDGRSLLALIGVFGGRTVAIRLSRSTFTKRFAERDTTAVLRFLERHADDVMSSLTIEGDRLTRGATDRADPMIFLVDEHGSLTGSLESVAEGPEGSLRTHFMPRANSVAQVVRPIVSELLARWQRGGASRYQADLPFGLVRLLPLRERSPREFVVSVELLRTRATLGDAAQRYSISKRELQVLGGMLRGAPVAEIASELSISSSTVVFHLKRMLKKTASRNRTELAARMLGWEAPAV